MLKWIFLLYMLGCILLLGLIFRKDKKEFAVRLVIALCLPVVGFLMPNFWPKRWVDRGKLSTRVDQLALLEEANDATQFQAGTLYRPEAEKEMNVVPLEETLLVNDLTARRRAMIDLLKQDSLEYLEVLQMAVGNEDTETSHYAVSAIVEVKRKLTLALQEMSVAYQSNKNDPHLVRSYADILKSYMRSGFLDDRTLLKHRHTYSSLLGQLLELAPDSPGTYSEKIANDLELAEYAAAENTARTFLERYPRSEDAYLSLMNVYYSTRSYHRLMEVVNELKASPVRLSNPTLTMIRFWSEGARNEIEGQAKA
ncbi:hypothetical protein [Paenibacillus silviterrae]|uniref:hypothetical protein n=1 Tax=Paenibacillus silviterrae TaxID=3242194 RepID=UPI0025437690|nr:hypothetical protein [Paenibacillus chinjuensis]